MFIVIIFYYDVDMSKETNKDTDDSSVLSTFHREKPFSPNGYISMY
jgi:hypothetical protein